MVLIDTSRGLRQQIYFAVMFFMRFIFQMISRVKGQVKQNYDIPHFVCLFVDSISPIFRIVVCIKEKTAAQAHAA